MTSKPPLANDTSAESYGDDVAETAHAVRARARTACVQIQLKRAIDKDNAIHAAFDLVGAFIVSSIVFAAVFAVAFWLFKTAGPDVLKNHPVLVALVMLLGFGWGVVAFCSVVLAAVGLFYALTSPVKLLGAGMRSLSRGKRTRRYFEQLARDGMVVLGPSHRDGALLEALAKDSADLIYGPKTSVCAFGAQGRRSLVRVAKRR